MRYLFDDYVLDTLRRELHQAGAPRRLRPKVFQVLTYLLAHRDRVVSKQELLDQVWPNQFVGGETLKSCITTLRKALQDQGRQPRLVRTLHGQGYRFVGTVDVREHLPADVAGVTQPGHWPEGRSAPAELSPPTLTTPPEALEPPTRNTLDGAYRHVTVLCGALVEAATLAAKLGPEAMHYVMHDVLALAQDTVQAYGGTLTQISGEGFLALFGALMAQEDHARRAVLAAIELRRRVHDPAAIRGQLHGVAVGFGVHTGPVVVGPLAHEPQRLYTAAGETIQLAHQLQQEADPNTILVSGVTYGLVQDEVQGEMYDLLSRSRLMTSAPVYAVHEVSQRRGGVPQRGTRVLSRFVGRVQELRLLHARLAQACGGQGQVVGIVGEPGLGKTRLLAEFVQRTREQRVTGCQGHCLPFDRTTPYLPVRELFRELWNLHDAAPAALTATVYQRLQEAGVTTAEDGLLLLQLLDLPADLEPLAGLSPPLRKARTFAVLRQLIRHVSQRQPLLLMVENLHWIDPTSEAWLASLIEHLGDMSLLLVTTYRPGYQPPWITHSAATQMALPHLSRRDSLVILQSVPQAAQLPTALQQAIVAKAAGNPFFVEELGWAATQEDALDPLPLPDTVEAVLAARLDQLPAEAKHLVQIAAVVGPIVPVPLLQRLAELPEDRLQHGLAQLQEREFLYELDLAPEQTYTFKHALTREVAYGSLLHERRRTLHERTAEAVEALYAQQPENHVGELAHHYYLSGNAEKAVFYCQQAGEQALQRSANPEAVQHLSAGLHLLTTLPATLARAQQELDFLIALGPALGATKGHGAPEIEQTYARAQALCAQIGDTPQLIPALWGLCWFYRNRAMMHTAREVGEQLYRLVQHAPAPLPRLEAHVSLGTTLLGLGEYADSWLHLDQGISLIDQMTQEGSRGVPHGVTCLAYAANTWWCLGFPEQALRRSREALALAQRLDRPQSVAVAHQWAAFLHYRRRDVPAVQAQAEALLALVRAHEFPLWRGFGTCWRGWALAMTGQSQAGIRQIHRGMAVLLDTGEMAARPICLLLLADAVGQAGQVQEALRFLAEALTVCEASGWGDMLTEVYRLQGELLLQPAVPQTAQAEAAFQQALVIGRRQQAKSWELRAALSLTRLWRQQSKSDVAERVIAPLYNWFSEGHDTADLQQARALLTALSE